MSILIKGMEMPKDVPLLIQVSPNGRVKLYNTKRTILTAVEVKPHGRLEDADK